MQPGENVLVYVIVALCAMLAGAIAALAYTVKKLRANGGKPDIRLQVADALRVEINKDKLATVILTSAEHTLQITALRKDVDELAKAQR